MQHPDYLTWALDQRNPSPKLLSYEKWTKANYNRIEEDTFDRKKTPPAQSAKAKATAKESMVSPPMTTPCSAECTDFTYKGSNAYCVIKNCKA